MVSYIPLRDLSFKNAPIYMYVCIHVCMHIDMSVCMHFESVHPLGTPEQ